MNDQVGLVLTTTRNLQMRSAEPSFTQLRGVERGVNSVVKASHFSGVMLRQK